MQAAPQPPAKISGTQQSCGELNPKKIKIKFDNKFSPDLGTIKYSNGNIYHGELKNKQPNGTGKMDFADGKVTSYEGDWKNSVPDGKGILVWVNGDTYKDDIVNGV